MSVQLGTVKTNQLVMDFCKFGRGKGTIVIIPGLSVQSVMPAAEDIAKAYDILTDDYTLYVFDRRKDQVETYSIADMARDTAKAMRSLGLEKANVFGASQGGMIAMSMAIMYPDLVEKLVLASTSSSVTETGFKTVENWVSLAKTGDAHALYDAFGKAIYPQAVYKQSKDLLSQAAGTVTEQDLKRFVVFAQAIRGFDITADLCKIKCPVLIIGSSDDAVLGSEAAEVIRDNLKNSAGCEYFMYEGYGHAVYDLAPDFHKRVYNFLKK